jgi:predicted TIM-barrel fold metal-dependent hydrolase
METESGIGIASFNNYLEAVDMLIDKAYKLGAVALKNILAYERTLLYERTTACEAQDEFNKIFKTKNLPDWTQRPLYTGKKFQDYIFHHILDIANKKNLVIQVHTGIQEGNGNILDNTRPELLSDLFLQYPDVDFDLFHIGYPFQNSIIVLAKNFPNVYVDMCWSHIVSPAASIDFIDEFIDAVPLNKLSGFGGDYSFIDGVYGHQYLARANIAEALTKKISDGLFDIDKAKEIAEMFLYRNPLKIFRLKGKI